MTSSVVQVETRTLLDAAREALTECSDELDGSAVQMETPLPVLFLDSLMAVNFITTLEAKLGVSDLPFERWLAEHSEMTDVLTVASLVEWLRSLPQMAGRVVGVPGHAASDASSRER